MVIFLKDKLFSSCLNSFRLMQFNIGVGVCDGGMMKIIRDLVSDKVWQL
jgi:hypothetical protein